MIIKLEEIEFEPWASTEHVGATYRGKPFTGVARQIVEGFYKEYHYKDGRAHGKWYEYDQVTGEVLVEAKCKMGGYVGEVKEWQDGFRKEYYFKTGTRIKEKIWNPKGILIWLKDDTVPINERYYNDGSLYKEIIQKNNRNYYIHYLGKKSLWLVKALSYDEEKNQYLHEFNGPLIEKNLKSLNSSFHESIISIYAEHLVKNDPKKAFIFLKKLCQHLDPIFQVIGTQNFAKLGILKSIQYLENIQGSEKMTFQSRDDKLWNISYGYESLDTYVKKAIREINKRNGKK